MVAKPVATRHVILMVLLLSSRQASENTVRIERTQPRRRGTAPPLKAAMHCEAAFRTVASHYLGDLTAQHRASCEGNADALHQMRLALTRLRTAIAFFSPMVAGPQQMRLKDELRWLNAHLGAVRDIDVAIERLNEVNKRRSQAENKLWSRERADKQRNLTRVLRSVRYRRLVKSISDWIENGSWSTKRGKPAANQRACPVTDYSERKLTLWQEKLIKRSRRLREIGAEKRHRLRLMNKRFTYAIESVAGLASEGETSKLRTMLRVLRKAQRSLGQLNDDARYRSLATKLGRGDAEVSKALLGHKHEKRLLRAAAEAYEKLADLKPLRL